MSSGGFFVRESTTSEASSVRSPVKVPTVLCKAVSILEIHIKPKASHSLCHLTIKQIRIVGADVGGAASKELHTSLVVVVGMVVAMHELPSYTSIIIEDGTDWMSSRIYEEISGAKPAYAQLAFIQS